MAKPKDVVIIGGSLAGLMSGIVLKRNGHHVRILERNPSPHLHNQGAGIVFGAQSQEFFQKFIQNQKRFTVSSYLRQTLDREGKSIPKLEERYTQSMISWDLVYYVLRAEFDGVEDGYVDVVVPRKEDGEEDVSYEYGCTAIGLKNMGEKVEVEFRDTKGDTKNAYFDLVIGADGPSSSLRKIFLPDVKRTYAGYVAWRGTLLESDAPESLRSTFEDNFTFFHDHAVGIQILAYLIPGEKGTLDPGRRLINWVWYCNYLEGSEEFNELMKDSDGNSHIYTLPVGKIQQEVWEKQKRYASEVLPSQFSTLVNLTKSPFVQAITDVLSPESSFLESKVLLVGDAVAGFRPHTGGSTSQAAHHALLLDCYLEGNLEWKKMEVMMMDHAKHMSEVGIRLGKRSQFS